MVKEKKFKNSIQAKNALKLYLRDMIARTNRQNERDAERNENYRIFYRNRIEARIVGFYPNRQTAIVCVRDTASEMTTYQTSWCRYIKVYLWSDGWFWKAWEAYNEVFQYLWIEQWKAKEKVEG